MGRIDYSSWQRLSLSVSNLKLDKENPRIPSYVTVRTSKDVLNYLIQNEQIERLAYKIVEKGFICHDPIYVIKEKDNYIVVEGNRRISALKCLLNPELVPALSKRRKIETYKKRLGINLIEKVDVFVAPSRRAVENVLFELHAEGKLQWSRQQKNKFIAGIGIDSGESVEQIADRFNVKSSEIEDSVQEYLLEKYFPELGLPDEIEDKALMSKFNISTLSRLVNSNYFRDETGLQIEGNKLKTTCSKAFFDDLLRRFVTDIVNKKIDSRKLNKIHEIDGYIKNEIEKTGSKKSEGDIVYFSPKINSKKNAQNNEPKDGQKKHRETLIPKGEIYLTGSEKLDILIEEAQGILIDTHKNSSALMLRSILEIAIVRVFEIYGKKEECLNNNGRIKNLSENVRTLVRKDSWFEDKAYLTDFKRFISKDNISWISLESLNRYAHGEYTIPDKEMLKSVWLTLVKPLVKMCIVK